PPFTPDLCYILVHNSDVVLDGSSTLTLPAANLQQLTQLFEHYLLSRSQQHGFLALPSHPADTDSLLQLQFLFDILQKTISLKLINPPDVRLQSVLKIFPFKSLKCLELKRIPPHCLEGLRGVYSQLEVFTCSKSLSSLEELLSLCGGDLSSALPWLELHTLNFSYNSIVCLDQSLSLLNVLRSLDLSHNKIQECAEFLKPLSELKHLNLGYNCLQRAPTLGPSARAKLLTLVLRNNELETINGVEQLSSLQHLDLAYNLLLEHSQLAPLSLLHSLNTLNLEGNPLYFQKTHRICTVGHLSPKAASLRVLPKPGQLIVQVQTLPSTTAVPSDRSNQEVSSGAGELSDSVSVGEVGVSNLRKKKSRSKVKVRRASISEPSDTDYEPRPLSSTQGIILPHQEEIERMSIFREQLGQDWLRYQHHLDDGASSTITTTISANLADPHCQTIFSGLNATTLCPPTDCGQRPFTSASMDVLGILPPQLLSLEPKGGSPCMNDTDSTLQWLNQSNQHSESTLDDSIVDGLVVSQGGEKSQPSPESQSSARVVNGNANQEEEEDLGVDLCHPLLVGVLSDNDDGNSKGQRERKGRREVFLRVKQGLVLEVDMQCGQERCRLELDSLFRVETTEAAWTRGVEKLFPAVDLQFDYINKDKRRRCYVLLDDDPQHALQALTEILSHVVEENRCSDSEFWPSCVRLQCLRCRSEFALQGETRKTQICPECGSDHVVQVTGHSAPYSSTPIHRSSRLDSENDHLDITQSTCSANKVSVNTQRPCNLFGSIQSRLLSSIFLICDGPSWNHIGHAAPSGKLAKSKLKIVLFHHNHFILHDYEAVDHRLKLFLDVEVFEKEEELHSFLKMSAVKFGEPGEVPSLLVVSDQRIYFLEITSGLTDWLQKKDSYPIMELSYLEVGLGSQSIHMEYGDSGVAYTLLVRDSVRCKRFFGLLTGIVREMAHKSDSKLKSISTTRLTPQHHLWPLVCEDIQADMEDGQLQFFYILAFILQEDIWMPLTVLVTRETLYLLQEDHQWRKNQEPCSSSVTVLETLPISCVSSILLWPSNECRMDIKLYDETVKQEKTWCVRSESSELLQGLLAWVRAQWEAMFGVKLHTTQKKEKS
uniref:Serine/threonine-protein kinase 11-interacting protein n=1 Tax=Amphiprion ocellaris TaxID=80972 RepID=A0AAQ6AJZ6_AMPOC